MLGKLVFPEIRELIETGDDETLREVVNRWLPADLGELLAVARARTSGSGSSASLTPGLAAETFEYLDLETQLSVLGSISRRGVGEPSSTRCRPTTGRRCWPSCPPSSPTG